jgi:ABC-type transport system substrate-binding protein
MCAASARLPPCAGRPPRWPRHPSAAARSPSAPGTRRTSIYSFTQSRFLPDSPRNILKVNDPPLTDLILRQRRLVDLAKRRELIHDIQRHLARQVYRAEAYSTVLMGVWDPALKNYGPNLGFDYGGRLIAAWLDR